MASKSGGQRADMAAVAHAALEAARKHGAAQAAAQVSRGRFVDIGFRDGDLEKATASAKQGLSIRLFIEGRYGSHATSDLREQTIEGFVAKAAQLTRLLEPDLLRSLPDPARYAKGQAPDLGLWDEALEQSEVEEWMGRARRVEDLTRAEGAKAGTLVSAQGGAYVETSRELLATSDGFLGEQAESGAYAVAGVTLMDPGQEAKRRGGYWWRAGHSLAELGGQAELAQVAATAAARAVRQLGAHPGPSGRVQVLVENQAAGRLLGDLLGALSGAALRQERSYLRRSQGQSVAAPLLTVRDEPLIPGGYGSRWYDPEGVAASPLSIIEGGRLVNFYLDTYYARALEMPPTTGGQSNTVLTPSAPGGFAEIMAGLERGLAVTSFLGGNFNATTGDFSYGLQGLWIEGGKVAHAVEGMNMAGNFKDLWPALARVGDDAFPYARLRSPSLLFAGVQLSGASLAPGQAAG